MTPSAQQASLTVRTKRRPSRERIAAALYRATPLDRRGAAQVGGCTFSSLLIDVKQPRARRNAGSRGPRHAPRLCLCTPAVPYSDLVRPALGEHREPDLGPARIGRPSTCCRPGYEVDEGDLLGGGFGIDPVFGRFDLGFDTGVLLQ
jgi:hypothetical protein